MHSLTDRSRNRRTAKLWPLAIAALATASAGVLGFVLLVAYITHTSGSRGLLPVLFLAYPAPTLFYSWALARLLRVDEVESVGLTFMFLFPLMISFGAFAAWAAPKP